MCHPTRPNWLMRWMALQGAVEVPETREREPFSLELIPTSLPSRRCYRRADTNKANVRSGERDHETIAAVRRLSVSRVADASPARYCNASHLASESLVWGPMWHRSREQLDIILEPRMYLSGTELPVEGVPRHTQDAAGDSQQGGIHVPCGGLGTKI
jgi:hypothetical protein